MGNLVDTKGAAPLAGVSPSTLENWRVAGTGPKFIKAGRKVVYDPRDIEEWRNARRVSSTSQMVAA